MSTNKPNQKSSHDKLEPGAPGNSTHAQRKHSADPQTPRPFDDDDSGGDGVAVPTTSSPGGGNVEIDF